MAMSMSIAVIMLVEEGGADEVECEANASHYKYQLWVLNMLEGDEALDGLQQDAQTQSKEKGAIEESAEELRTCPAKGKVLGRLSALCHLDSYKGDNEANKIIELRLCKY